MFRKFIYFILVFFLNAYDGLIVTLLYIGKFRPCSIKAFGFVTNRLLYSASSMQTECQHNGAIMPR